MALQHTLVAPRGIMLEDTYLLVAAHAHTSLSKITGVIYQMCKGPDQMANACCKDGAFTEQQLFDESSLFKRVMQMSVH